ALSQKHRSSTHTTSKKAGRALAATSTAKTVAAPERRIRLRRNPDELLWGKQYLEAHATTPAFARKNNVVINPENIVFTKTQPLSGALLNSTRTRHKVPPINPKTGKEMKFTQKSGEAFPYFPTHWDWPSIFADSSVDIFIVESECSALAAAQRGFVTIGVGGCDGVFMVGTRRQKLHPIFSEMRLAGRRVYVVFDADRETNDNVHDAEQAAAKLFAEAVQ
ncbi:MAG: DUF3854 domain-containing protein, partial [Terracidiphilus sp.]